MDITVFELGIVIGISFLFSYFIGELTYNEIDKISNFGRIFNPFYLIIESILFIVFSLTYREFIFIFSGIAILVNLLFGSLFTALKDDFNELLGYSIIFIIFSFLVSLI